MSAQDRINPKLKKDAQAIFKAALTAVDPARAVSNAVQRQGDTLKIVQGKKSRMLP